MTARDLPGLFGWMRQGTDVFTATLGTVDDLSAASLLPGWSRAHVAAHVARNAEALGRLAAWARTGVETPMYPDPARRDDDIEISSRRPASDLRTDVAVTAAALDEALAALSGDRWRAQVRSASGRRIPATEIPWLRVREVWLHAVDLDADAALDRIPDGVVDSLLDDVTAAFAARTDAPAVRLVPHDRSRTWAVHPDQDDAVTVEGAAADLAGWLVGRHDGTRLSVPGATSPPRLPAWL